MMKVTSRGDLDKLRGSRAKAAPAPDRTLPPETAPAQGVDPAQFAAMMAAMSSMAASIERTSELVATLAGLNDTNKK